MTRLNLSCRCGAVQGHLRETASRQTGYIVCHCSDCQKFAHYLDAADDTLDQYGGSDIVQLPLNRMVIEKGLEHLRCLKLSEKGPLRWYAECCNTPIANTLGANMPFLSVLGIALKTNGQLQDQLGPVSHYLHCTYAVKPRPEQPQHPAFPKRVVAGLAFRLLISKLKGEHKPSPLFTDEGRPIQKPIRIQGDPI